MNLFCLVVKFKIVLFYGPLYMIKSILEDQALLGLKNNNLNLGPNLT